MLFLVRSRMVFLIVAGMCLAGTACTTLGPGSLKADQVDYARALGDAKKRQILRITVQSIAGLDNAAMLGGATGSGSPV